MLNQLELQARDKERDKEALKVAVVSLFRLGRLDSETLKRAIDQAFLLGHNAGHCRGEQYVNQLMSCGAEKL